MESSPVLLPAHPAAPVAPYLGGKRNLARRIIQRLNASPHNTYVEPFVGMGGVFFRRPFRARCEVINDISTDVTNLFRILQRHPVALMDELRWKVTSRAEFERLRAATADTLTDLERAMRFLYLQRTAFGGKIEGRTFGVDTAGPARFDVTKLTATLEAAHERLASVVIERLPYLDLIARYDRATTMFYLDPPYWGCEGDYGAGVFSCEDFVRLADALSRIEGQFILSLNDRPEVREVFAAFEIEAVETTYSVARRSAGNGRAGEVLISNPRTV